jgi:choloylglycine hydrolase
LVAGLIPGFAQAMPGDRQTFTLYPEKVMTFQLIGRAALALLAASALVVVAAPAAACTTFRLQSQDGAWLIGRSMELGMSLDSQVMLVPRGYRLTSTRPDLKPGMDWTVKHGFAGINTLGKDLSTDGMNEAGLSVGTLYFPGFAGYQPFPADGKHAVSNLDFSNWALSQFATVGEVREALSRVAVYDLNLPLVGPQALHWAIADAQGGAIVVEYVGGKLTVYDNPIGVMTNAPPFDWHLTNLRAHINLTNINVDALKLGTVQIQPIGQGTGLLGLPGDYTPPSRFLKAVALAYSSVPVATAIEGVNLAFHILNAVDIPIGAVAEKVPSKTGGAPTLAYEQTQWATVHDLKNRISYFRTYGNLDLRKVELKRVDFDGKAIQHVAMPTAMEVEDVTPTR